MYVSPSTRGQAAAVAFWFYTLSGVYATYEVPDLAYAVPEPVALLPLARLAALMMRRIGMCCSNPRYPHPPRQCLVAVHTKG